MFLGGMARDRGITARAAVKDRRPPQAASASSHSSLTASTPWYARATQVIPPPLPFLLLGLIGPRSARLRSINWRCAPEGW